MLKRLLIVTSLLALTGVFLTGCAGPKGSTPEAKRTFTQEMRDTTLATLYERRPWTEEEIEGAAGHGVFSALGTKIIPISTVGGYGIVHDRATGEDTYMRAGGLGLGFGLGVKDYQAVMVFHDAETLEDFLSNRWEANFEADLAARLGDAGGALAGGANGRRSVTVYHITRNGLAITATLNATRYWRDTRLNDEYTDTERAYGDATDPARSAR
ncbi:MAG: hypothetical protein EA378_06110 [Phycisphaerales bacterium]|nr:MAG: hypothetical protein EA378_06110 [Phycisphaerales bacterium]